MPITTLIFDLDGTLYPRDSGYKAHVRKRIWQFMSERLGVPAEDAEAEWERLRPRGGSTLEALRLGGYNFDENDYWDFTRDGYSSFMKQDYELRDILNSLPQSKWVLTNCQRRRAVMCIEALGLTGCFEDILGADGVDLENCKPHEDMYKLCLNRAGVTASECVFFDDSLENVVAAKKLGMKGILVTSAAEEEELRNNEAVLQQVDAVISPVPTRANLQVILPELFHGAAPRSE